MRKCQLKSQLMTIFAIKSGGEADSMMMLIYGMMVMSLLEYISKAGPSIMKYLSERFKKKCVDHIKLPAISIMSRIVFERNYLNKSGDNLSDAMVEYICRQDAAIDLLYNDFYLVSNEDNFELTSDISVRVISKTFKAYRIIMAKN